MTKSKNSYSRHLKELQKTIKHGKLSCLRKIIKVKEQRNACLRRKLLMAKLTLRLSQLRMQVIRREKELNELTAVNELIDMKGRMLSYR